LFLIDRVYQYLVDQGIGRPINVSSSLAPIWREPADGTPAPGEGTGTEIGQTAVIGLVEGGGITDEMPFTSQWRRDQVDIHYRAMRSPDIQRLYIAVRRAVVDKWGWQMAGMRVISSVEARPLDLIDSSKAQGFHKVSAVLFETYEEDWG
jgi:hypothetical protein